jgi:predicted TIM-barrel fold metal-dependent hydrolase
MATDTAAFLGGYPFRHFEPATPGWLLSEMDRVGIDRAWVGYLPSFLYGDPGPANGVLSRWVESHRDRLLPVPVLHPGLPLWQEDLSNALAVGAPGVRLYPQYQGIDPSGDEMRAAVVAAAAAGVPAVLTVRFEDVRQRHPLDVAAELPPSAVRALARSDPDVRLLVTHAERRFVEEVHFGLTPEEAVRVLWEISWIWGPPEDHLSVLLETVGPRRFTLGTGMPLRIPDAVFAKLDLLDVGEDVLAGLLERNLRQWLKPESSS